MLLARQPQHASGEDDANEHGGELCCQDAYVEVAEVMPSGEVRLLIANYGGPAQRVIFGVVEGRVTALGMPPPASYMRSGESRLLALDLPANQDRQAVAVVTCFDLRGRHAYAFAAPGKQRRWRLRNPVTRRCNDISAHEMFLSLYPDSPSPANLDVVGHRLIERQISR